MFWNLYLAHLLGDYVLQTDGMARAKRHWRGLIVHTGVHLALLFVLAAGALPLVWTQLLTLAIVHFAIDSVKNAATNRWPERSITLYFADQALHLLSILLVAGWIQQRTGLTSDGSWIIYAVGYVLVTAAWFITERLLAQDDRTYRLEVQAQRWSRMALRALILTVYLIAGHALAGSALFAAGPILAGVTDSRRRALLIDLLVPVAPAILILFLA
jgi:hypothetical protein